MTESRGRDRDDTDRDEPRTGGSADRSEIVKGGSVFQALGRQVAVDRDGTTRPATADDVPG